MRTLVLGGTGRLGLALTRALIEADHTPVVFGRSAARVELPDGALAFAGDALDSVALAEALTGCEAVITALSIPRASRSPFAPVVGPHDLHSRNMGLLLPAMATAGVRRLIKVSAQSVGESAPRAGWGFRALVAMSNLRPAFADHAVADALVAASDRDWTIVRPPILAEEARGPLRAAPDLVTWSWTKVGIPDLAAWIAAALDQPDHHGQILSIGPA